MLVRSGANLWQDGEYEIVGLLLGAVEVGQGRVQLVRQRLQIGCQVQRGALVLAG